MLTYIPQSWGRTRRPKELEPNLPFDGTYDPTDPTRANIGIAADKDDLRGDLGSATEANNGYCTENQRFLHVFIKGTGAHLPASPRSVQIWCYNYAFREWGPLLIKNPSASGYEIATATEHTVSGRGGYYIFDIDGVDRVAFVTAQATPPTRVRAACSTF